MSALVLRLGMKMKRSAHDVLWTAIKGPCRGWILIFLLSNALISFPDSANPNSRLATLCAMVEDKSFRIDHYQYWTIDWAQTPNGHYYSNKPPGPILFGCPVFWAVDKWLTFNEPDRAARDRVREARSSLTLMLLSLLFQVVPFAIVVMLALGWLEKSGAPPAALHLSCAAMLFGNTASLFMNTYFGHAMAATWILALCLGLLRRQYLWSGLTYGLALLSDYSSVMLLPGFLLAVCVQESRRNWLRCAWQIALGGIVPGLVWAIYHTACFGGPFTLASRYQNPNFVDNASCEILGLFNLAPNVGILAQLLFGFRRGILWSQPWILIVLVAMLFRRFLLPRLSNETWLLCMPLWRFILPGFVLLLWMNASFGQWDAGMSPGPRYMCLMFPAIGLLAGFCYTGLSPHVSRLLEIAVGFAVAFWITVYSTTVLVPSKLTMWGFTLHRLMSDPSNRPLLRLCILLAAFEWQFITVYKSRAVIKP
jgi:hypothetical protein